MHGRSITWLALALLAVGLGATWITRRSELLALQRELTRTREAQSARIQPQSPAVPPSQALGDSSNARAAEEEADRAAIVRWRAEIQQIKARALARAQPRNAPKEVAAPPLSMLNEMVPSAQWKNAGQATPAATFETALWAAAAGDVDALSRLLSIDPVVRVEAIKLMQKLPESLRHEYTTPEQVIALFSARDVPVDGAAQVLDPGTTGPVGTRLVAVVRGADNSRRQAHLTLKQEGAGWRFVVPVSAVERYAALIKGPVAP